jgi:uncharacterized protein YyaL (SSP411 family)
MRRRADWVLGTLAEPLERFAPAFGHLLGAADLAVHGSVEVALVGRPPAEDFQALAREVAAHYVPALVLAGGEPGSSGGVALLYDRPMQHGRATAYVCRQFTCDAPVNDAASLGEQLEHAVRAHAIVSA